MVAVTIVVRNLSRPEPEYSLPFDLPEIPKVGSYISVFRSDGHPKWVSSDDLIVRHVWWELEHLTRSDGMGSGQDEEVIGHARSIMVECDHAIGPYLVERHRHFIEMEAEAKGITVERLPVSRIVLSQES